ncbi:hypothetical protein FRZ61_25590 [Hypericibacter adhaerens]|uniref:Uncharacterized protein n=1 Tax=Hypericibacter adhaerens TaxID=2602016 RepID=A0A5J6MZN8_9PROT|nr:hypothetical protein FRZ61_25590 [Hypericibacter adhaerens]
MAAMGMAMGGAGRGAPRGIRRGASGCLDPGLGLFVERRAAAQHHDFFFHGSGRFFHGSGRNR